MTTRRGRRKPKIDERAGEKPEEQDSLQVERARQLQDNDPWSTPAMIEALEERLRERQHLDELEDMRPRQDGYYRNEVTGIGQWERDKTFGGRSTGPAFVVGVLLSREIEDRWRGNDFGEKIVSKIPEEMVREGFDVVVSPTEDGDPAEGSEQVELEEEAEEMAEGAGQLDAFPPKGPPAQPAAAAMPPVMMAPPKPKAPLPEVDDEAQEIAEAVEGKLDELEWAEVFFEAMCYERAYGGAAIYVGVSGESAELTGDLTTPIDETRIDDITHLTAFAGGWDGEVIAYSYYDDPLAPKYGKPRIYMLRSTSVPMGSYLPGERLQRAPNAGQMRFVHESRLLIFPGMAPSKRSRAEQRGWADGVFTRVDKVLSEYDQAWGGISISMTELNQTIFGLTGLFEKLATEKGKGPSFMGKIAQRMQQVQQTKSVARAIVHDKDKESAQILTSQLGGVGEVLDRFESRIAAVCEMSKAELFGEDTGGLSENGQGMRYKNNRTRARQNRVMLRPLRKLVRWIFLSKNGPTQGEEPERWRIKWRPLWLPTEQEVATTRKTVAETDNIYITAGVLTPEEVAASAYGGSAWSMERNIDFDGREQMAAEEAARAEEMKAQMQPGAEKPPESEQDPGESKQAAENLNKPTETPPEPEE